MLPPTLPLGITKSSEEGSRHGSADHERPRLGRPPARRHRDRGRAHRRHRAGHRGRRRPHDRRRRARRAARLRRAPPAPRQGADLPPPADARRHARGGDPPHRPAQGRAGPRRRARALARGPRHGGRQRHDRDPRASRRRPDPGAARRRDRARPARGVPRPARPRRRRLPAGGHRQGAGHDRADGGGAPHGRQRRRRLPVQRAHVGRHEAPTSTRSSSSRRRFDAPVDMHADFADDASDPRYAAAGYIAEKTIEHGFEGRVSLGHVTSLASLDARGGRAGHRRACATPASASSRCRRPTSTSAGAGTSATSAAA